MEVLFLTDYSRFTNYEKHCNKKGFSYIDYIKREQRFLKDLLNRKYSKTKVTDDLRVIVYIHADFGNRQENHYKVVSYNSPDYKRFMQTDDYSDLFSLSEAIETLNRIL